MENIFSLNGGAIMKHFTRRTTNISNSMPGSRGRWGTVVRGSVAFVTTLLAGLMMLLLLPAGARADSFTVTDVNDLNSASGNCTDSRLSKTRCSLRAAINASNANKKSNNIYLPKGDYQLRGPLPPITGSLVISGDGAWSEPLRSGATGSTTIWGPCKTNQREEASGHCVPFASFRGSILSIAASGHLALAGMKIQGGFSDISGETGFGAGGITNEGNLELVRVTLMGNGTHTGAGGILSMSGGSVLLDRSTVRDNFSHHGPGAGIVIESGSTVTIIDSTISGNQSVASDGDFSGFGGGIWNDGLLIIQNSTISGNRVSTVAAYHAVDELNEGGGIFNQGEAWLKSVTITANHGFGVKNVAPPPSPTPRPEQPGQFHFNNTIIAGNGATTERFSNGDEITSVGNAPDCFGDLTSLRGNLVGDPGLKSPNGSFPCNIKDWPSLPRLKASDSIGRVNFDPSRDFAVGNTFDAPVLSGEFRGQNNGVPLLKNNGGHTCTIALCTGNCRNRGTSFAANHGWPKFDPPAPPALACTANDQRGAARSNTCDTGAFETGSLSPLSLPALKCSGLEELKK